MKARLAQHTIDCTGDPDTAREAWRSQGMAWLPLPGLGWSPAVPEPGSPAWTWTSQRFGARLSILHLVEPGLHGARIHARAEVEGPLAWLHRLLLQPRFRQCLPPALRAVARSVATGAA